MRGKIRNMLDNKCFNFYFVQQCLGMEVFWMGMPKMKQLCQLRGLPSEITALLKLFYILDTKVFFLALRTKGLLLREFSVKCRVKIPFAANQ